MLTFIIGWLASDFFCWLGKKEFVKDWSRRSSLLKFLEEI